jgi:hypothetical protein
MRSNLVLPGLLVACLLAATPACEDDDMGSGPSTPGPSSSLAERYMSGDPRLGLLFDHTAGVEFRFVLLSTGDRRELTASLGYDLSVLRYREETADITITSHSPMITLGATY